MLRETLAAIIDISNFAKYEVKGNGGPRPGQRTVRQPHADNDGRSCLTPLIGKARGIAGTSRDQAADDEHGHRLRMAERFTKVSSRPSLPKGTTFRSRHRGISALQP